MDLWWEQMATYTKRDQLSLPYVLYKSDLRIKLWDWNYKFENPYFKRYLHRRGTLSDLNVLLKNKRYYNRFYDVTCGATLSAYHGAPQTPAHRSAGLGPQPAAGGLSPSGSPTAMARNFLLVSRSSS